MMPHMRNPFCAHAAGRSFSLRRPSFSSLQGERHQPLYFQENIYATRYPDGPQPTLSLQSIQPSHSQLEI